MNSTLPVTNVFSALEVTSDTDDERSLVESTLEPWKVAVVQRAEVMYGRDVWPRPLLPPIPDVPCFTCRARTHLQATCPLAECENCGLFGHHQSRYCQGRRP